MSLRLAVSDVFIVIDQALAKMPIPKVMSYQLADGETTVQFVRPVHRLIAMHGNALARSVCLVWWPATLPKAIAFRVEKIALDNAERI